MNFKDELKIDIDDYINKLHKEIDYLKSSIISLKSEIKTQRKEIKQLKLGITHNKDNTCIDY